MAYFAESDDPDPCSRCGRMVPAFDPMPGGMCEACARSERNKPASPDRRELMEMLEKSEQARYAAQDEVTRLRATLARVEALAQKWHVAKWLNPWTCLNELRAALDGKEGEP